MMSHAQERPRRLSYAGLVKVPVQKSRRISDGGQFVLKSSTGIPSNSSSASVAEAEAASNAAVMLHSLDGMNNSNSGRYDVNKNRPARRISRADDSFMCSQQSVLSAMDRFVKAVDNMDSTVLVPSRLQDIDVHNENCEFTRCLPAGIDNVDVYGFYSMLKEVKTELLWGPSVGRPAPSIPSSGRTSPNNPRILKHIRQSSDDSLGSTGFPSDQETDSDIESVLTDRDSVEEQSSSPGSHLALAFRHHLLGLHTILHELADSADYLSTRYQQEIDSASF